MGASQALSTWYARYKEKWERSPATAADWTLSEVGGVESGYKDV